MFCLNLNTFFYCEDDPAQFFLEGFRILIPGDILGMVLGNML